MKYYCVTTKIPDKGAVISNVVDCIEAKEKPQSKMTSTPRADIYSD